MSGDEGVGEGGDDVEEVDRAVEGEATGAAPRKRPSLRVGVAFLVAFALVCVFVVAQYSTSPSAAKPTHHRTRAKAHHLAEDPQWAPAIGVYSGPVQVSTARAFDVQKRGPVPYALDFIDSTSWKTISDPQWMVDQWKKSKFHMVFGVPMLPDHGGTLSAGATGAYDTDFLTLATMLVANGEGDAVLMIGWNPLQPGTSWQVTTKGQAAEYVRYWRHIIETMHGVHGANFLFEWDGGTSDGSVSAMAVYPGDPYVNLIATNAFDQVMKPNGGSRWLQVAQAINGPDWFAKFAASHHKPLVIGEWGLVPSTTPGGGGDDVAFVQNFLKWSRTNHVALAVTWDFGTWQIMSPSFFASDTALQAEADTGGSPTAVRALEGQQPGT
jgi:hypothetical protein